MTKKTALEIFINFCDSVDIDETHAKQEFERIERYGLTIEEYSTIRRVGSYYPMNRLERHQLYRLYENACNHATFFDGV